MGEPKLNMTIGLRQKHRPRSIGTKRRNKSRSYPCHSLDGSVTRNHSVTIVADGHHLFILSFSM